MSYQVSLPNFEGPLDLLLHLVKKAEVDIYEISISEITDQYMAYIETWEQFNLEIASEFLVMAAKLMELKSRELLPKTPKHIQGEPVDEDEDEDEDELKQALLNKLAEYKFFKEISLYLQDKEKERMQVYWKEKEALPSNPNKEISLGAGKVADLVYAFQKVLHQYEEKQRVAKIDTESVSIQKQKQVLVSRIKHEKNKTIQFMDLFKRQNSRIIIIVTFLALLDLVKTGQMRITQYDKNSPIWLTLTDQDAI